MRYLLPDHAQVAVCWLGDTYACSTARNSSFILSATIIAYISAIIIAELLHQLHVLGVRMSINYGAAIRSRRDGDRSVVTPTVLIDAPRRSHPRKALHSIHGGNRRTSSRQGQSRYVHDEFRYFIDRQGRQHFNFRQQVWLDASVQMAYTSVYSVALKTLAVNLLTLVTRKRDYQAAVGLTSRRVVALAASFSRECLLGAPNEAWALPKASIKAWLDSRPRVRSLPRPRRSEARS
jgi:hypothetical protein